MWLPIKLSPNLPFQNEHAGETGARKMLIFVLSRNIFCDTLTPSRGQLTLCATEKITRYFPRHLRLDPNSQFQPNILSSHILWILYFISSLFFIYQRISFNRIKIIIDQIVTRDIKHIEQIYTLCRNRISFVDIFRLTIKQNTRN